MKNRQLFLVQVIPPAAVYVDYFIGSSRQVRIVPTNTNVYIDSQTRTILVAKGWDVQEMKEVEDAE